jgi:hypothetical protein
LYELEPFGVSKIYFFNAWEALKLQSWYSGFEEPEASEKRSCEGDVDILIVCSCSGHVRLYERAIDCCHSLQSKLKELSQVTYRIVVRLRSTHPIRKLIVMDSNSASFVTIFLS